MDKDLDFGILLGLGYQTFVDELNSWMADQGFADLGRNYGYVFRALHEEPLQLNQLAERLGMTNQGALKIVNEMESRDYVDRHDDPQDGRAKLLKLAARGKAAVKAARRFHSSFELALRKRLGAAKVDALRAALEAMITDGADAAHRRLRPM
jgi:DNA-binding MarR family transcriptional regulator